jgi:hypothetical protein
MNKIKKLYDTAKSAKVGDNCKCPSCGTEFIKTNYQQAFCKTKSGTKCKDKYWNTVTPEKRNNTTRISPASARFMANQYNHLKPMVYGGVEKFQGYTSEGYRIWDGVAYNEFDEAVYRISGNSDAGDSEYWDNSDNFTAG